MLYKVTSNRAKFPNVAASHLTSETQTEFYCETVTVNSMCLSMRLVLAASIH